MQLKKYQQATLDALDRFLSRAAATDPAEAFAHEVALQIADAQAEGRTPEPRTYRALEGLPAVPYVCLRLPTGGGKTLLAAEAIRIAGRAWMRSDLPLTLWFVPSKAIKDQTLEALRDAAHPYRKRLDDLFGGRVRVFDVEAFEALRPQDLTQSACIVVATIQSFRVADTTGRRVYDHHEDLEAHFAGAGGTLPGMEVVTAEEAASSKGLLTVGRAKASFANLLYRHRPLMIVDEAHNAISGLTGTVQERLRPSVVIEFTATPRDRNNVLHSVTATALKDEEMIKLPIRVRPHGDWREAVSATVATRHMLESKAAGEREHLRPVALYQAQAKNGTPTVEELRRYLIDEKQVDKDHVKVATGEQRELDGVNLRDPNEQTRHVITVQALKEGWDCPSAYVLCATQRLESATAVEQLLGRVLRMPYAARRKDPALNSAYAHVSEPTFEEAAAKLRDKLIDMGFTDEEVRASLAPRRVEADAQGNLFDPSPVDPKPVFSTVIPDTAAAREAILRFQDEGVDFIPQTDGTLKIGVRGSLTPAITEMVERLAPESDRPAILAGIARHNDRVEARRSPAERGAVIDVPQLLAAMDGETFVAEADAILERTDWSLGDHPARLTETELSFRRAESVIEMDILGDRVVYRHDTAVRDALPGLALRGSGMEAGMVAWLERECRVAWLPSDALGPWIAAMVADLLAARGIGIETLIDWQHEIAARLRRKLDEIRQLVRDGAYQTTLFGNGDTPDNSHARPIRFDADVYRDVPTRPTGALRLNRHLLGPDRAPLTDGKVDGEEFQCALALDGLGAVDVWVRNIARHRDSFWLPRARHRFYPDFVARLLDGRILVVEYKGAHIVGAPEAREKEMIGKLWARRTENVFLMVVRDAGGSDPGEQMLKAVKL